MIHDVIEYATKKKEKIKSRIRAINEMNNDYLFFSDIDLFPCVARKKETINDFLEHQYDPGKTYILIREIESWYMAGLNEESCREFFGKDYRDTNNITKEMFLYRGKSDFNSDIDFKAEILKHFKIETACRKNKSFKYFYTKFFKTED
jgi:hypothetical protein